MPVSLKIIGTFRIVITPAGDDTSMCCFNFVAGRTREELLLAGGDFLALFNVADRKFTHQFEYDKTEEDQLAGPTVAAVAPVKRDLVVSARRSVLRFWSVTEEKLVGVHDFQRGKAISCLNFSPRGNLLAVGFNYGDGVVVVDVASTSPVALNAVVSSRGVECISFGLREIFVACGENAFLTLLDSSSEFLDVLQCCAGDSTTVDCQRVAVSPDGRFLAGAFVAGSAAQQQQQQPQAAASSYFSPSYKPRVKSVCEIFSRDGSQLKVPFHRSGSTGSAFTCFQKRTEESNLVIASHSQQKSVSVLLLAFLTDVLILCWSRTVPVSNEIVFFNVVLNREVLRVPLQPNVEGVVLSDDRSRLFTKKQKNEVDVYELIF